MSTPIAYTGTCPTCGWANCRVEEKFTQATRREPKKSLGFQGYCPRCDCSFGIDDPHATSLLGVIAPE